MPRSTTTERPVDEPQTSTTTTTTDGAPSPDVFVAGAGTTTAATGRPQIVPPGEASTAAASADAVTAVWHSGKKINALWSNTANRNAWIGIEGIGWKKLADNSDSALVALTMIASSAKQMGSTVNCREEADGKVYEIYVF